MLTLKRRVASFRSKLIAFTSSAATDTYAGFVCFLVSMLMGLPLRKSKPEVGVRVYTRSVEVARRVSSSNADYAEFVSGCARRCPSAILGTWTLFI